jgi:hypothetical protein
MKKILLAATAILFGATMVAQSLTVTNYVKYVGMNSTAISDYSSYVSLKNVSSTPKDVKVKRVEFSSTSCAFDSMYFCWDLCYGANVKQSVGSVTIAANEVNSFFTGHAYSKGDNGNCSDSTRYTFFVESNPNDSVSIVIVFQASSTFSVRELGKPVLKAYPNPANQVFVVELAAQPTANTNLEMFNMVGSKVMNAPLNGIKTELNVSHLPSGVYVYSIVQNGKVTDTRKLVVRH